MNKICVVFQLKNQKTQYNLLQNTKEGQLHGSIKSKLESVMEVGQEDCWLAKLQTVSGFLTPVKQA